MSTSTSTSTSPAGASARSAAATSGLLAFLAGDLGGPLRAVRALAETIDATAHLDPALVRACAATIRTTAAQLAAMVEDLYVVGELSPSPPVLTVLDGRRAGEVERAFEALYASDVGVPVPVPASA